MGEQKSKVVKEINGKKGETGGLWGGFEQGEKKGGRRMRGHKVEGGMVKK